MAFLTASCTVFLELLYKQGQKSSTISRMKTIPFHFTKIVATLGPASYSFEKIRTLIENGANLFRLNFSHGTHEDHAQACAWVRQAEKELGTTIGVIGDLQGPKFRLGPISEEKHTYAIGDRITLHLSGTKGTKFDLILPHFEIFQAVGPGNMLLIDDGKMQLAVLDVSPTQITVETKTAGSLSSRKGVNIPYVELPTSALTPKDKIDLKKALEMGVDYIALSFVQRKEDLMQARALIPTTSSVGLIAKIEKPSAIKDLETILPHCDGIMIARGDLGVEIPCEEVPPLQRKIIRLCRQKGLPVVVATQMLESMINSPTPTRAEASDVAVAVYEGADAVMLSAESASGAYPEKAVDTMCRIVRHAERDDHLQRTLQATSPTPQATAEDAISIAASQVAQTLDVAAIASFTERGGTAKRAARQRPHVPIIGITPHLSVARQLTLVWGVYPTIAAKAISSLDDVLPYACAVAKKLNLAVKNDKLVITAGMPFGEPGTTNLLRIADLKE